MGATGSDQHKLKAAAWWGMEVWSVAQENSCVLSSSWSSSEFWLDHILWSNILKNCHELSGILMQSMALQNRKQGFKPLLSGVHEKQLSGRCSLQLSYLVKWLLVVSRKQLFRWLPAILTKQVSRTNHHSAFGLNGSETFKPLLSASCEILWTSFPVCIRSQFYSSTNHKPNWKKCGSCVATSRPQV